ncbi:MULTISPECIES: helix-turn-helix domain-containing protein [Elizabethkingia]|uniref:helix-turn-helix domain-containing protein n=1 Tax=Elizabethkingia TaxID=308865 RepID=UPI001629AC07|nr:MULTISPECIES: XRE family transcriptional regulator [Elizabethkingia]MDV3885264.1 DNA-binding protein [Elizabethkingia anophelis]MDX8576821.1 XRE family transcriptional regulator [Elizabethkingia sp. HX WYD]HCZ8396918.1 ImmA/IrrE family metallo-endopeptidase [Elizabethkingia anophelis]
MNHKQLTFAREYRGMTQTELSESINGLSQSNLSKFEKGIDTISEEVQDKIIEYLGFPKDFYYRKINSYIDSKNYRKKVTIKKYDTLKLENTCRLIGYIIDEISDSIEWVDFKLLPLDVEEGYSPEYIANHTRRILGLKEGEPIKDICSLLENNGILIYEIDAIEKFDGVSFITDKGHPVIIVNRNFTNDRKRFTIAHELGHILMHDENLFTISEYRDKENEANRYGSEFLMPEKFIKHSLAGLKLSDLGSFKNYWLTSMASILRRAHDLKSINEKRYKFLLIEMSRLGYRKHEPGYVFIDEPKNLFKAYNLLKDELGYSSNDFINFFALPEDVLDDVFYFRKKNVKLKLV